MKGFLRHWIILSLAAVCALPAQLSGPALERLREAMEAASRQEYELSEKILLELEKAQPQEAEIQYHLGVILFRGNKLEAAGQRLESAAALMPDSPQVMLALGRVRLQLGKKSEAVQAIDRANSLAPNEPFVWRASAMFYEEAGDFAKAAEYEVPWLKAHPEDKVAPLRAMEYFIRANQPDPAIEIGGQITESEDQAVVHNLLGRAYRLKRDPAKAVDELQTAIRMSPAEPAFYADLAQLFLDHRTPEPALMVLEAAVRRFPENVALLRLLGIARYATGDTQKALDAFLKIVDADPDAEIGYVSLETLLPYAGDRLAEIVKKLRAFTGKHPSSPVGHYLLALALSTQSPESPESQKLLQKAIEVEPFFWPAYFEAHKKLEQEGNYEEALRLLERTAELNPAHEEAHYALSRIYARLGKKDQAIASRRTHHKLVLEKREATERETAEFPRLPYQVVGR